MGRASLDRADKWVDVDSSSQMKWVTLATLVVVAFMLFVAVTNALDPDDSNAERTTGALVFGVGALAVLGGMWLLRERRTQPVAYTLIVVPVLFTGVVFFWLFFIPTILATVIILGLWSGRAGRELRPASTPPPAR